MAGPSANLYKQAQGTSQWALNNKLLTLKANANIPQESAQDVTAVPTSTAKIMLPLAGLSANQPDFTIRFTFNGNAGCGFNARPVTQTAAVPAHELSGTSLAFSPRSPGEVAAVTVRCRTPLAGLGQSDYFTLKLGGFTGGGSFNAQDQVQWSPSHDYAFDGAASSWTNSHKLLKLSTNGPVAGDQLQARGRAEETAPA